MTNTRDDEDHMRCCGAVEPQYNCPETIGEDVVASLSRQLAEAQAMIAAQQGLLEMGDRESSDLSAKLAEAQEQAADAQRIGIEWMQKHDKRTKELAEAQVVLNYVADMTYCGADVEWHFKPGYDPQRVLDAIEPHTAAMGTEK